MGSRKGDLVKGIIGLYYYYRIYNSISTQNGVNIILNPLYYRSHFLDQEKHKKIPVVYLVSGATIEKKIKKNIGFRSTCKRFSKVFSRVFSDKTGYLLTRVKVHLWINLYIYILMVLVYSHVHWLSFSHMFFYSNFFTMPSNQVYYRFYKKIYLYWLCHS